MTLSSPTAYRPRVVCPDDHPKEAGWLNAEHRARLAVVAERLADLEDRLDALLVARLEDRAERAGPGPGRPDDHDHDPEGAHRMNAHGETLTEVPGEFPGDAPRLVWRRYDPVTGGWIDRPARGSLQDRILAAAGLAPDPEAPTTDPEAEAQARRLQDAEAAATRAQEAAARAQEAVGDRVALQAAQGAHGPQDVYLAGTGGPVGAPVALNDDAGLAGMIARALGGPVTLNGEPFAG